MLSSHSLFFASSFLFHSFVVFNIDESFQICRIDREPMDVEIVALYYLPVSVFLVNEVNEVKTKLSYLNEECWKSSLRFMIGSLWLSFNLGLQLVRPLRSFIFRRIMAVGYFHRACTIDDGGGGTNRGARTKSSFEHQPRIVRPETKKGENVFYFFSLFFSLSFPCFFFRYRVYKYKKRKKYKK